MPWGPRAPSLTHEAIGRVPVFMQRLFAAQRRPDEVGNIKGNGERRRGLINFLTWAFFLSEAFAHSDALALGRHSADAEGSSDTHANDDAAQLALSRPDGALLVQNAAPSTVSVETTTLYEQSRTHEFTPSGGDSGHGPSAAAADAGAGHVGGSGAGGAGADDTGAAMTAAASETPVESTAPDGVDIGIHLDQLPDTVDSLLDQTFGTVDNLLGTLDQTLEQTLDGVTSVLSPVVSILDSDAVSNLTGTLSDAVTPVTTTLNTITSDLAGVLGSGGSLSFGSVLGQAAGNELASNGVITDFGISLQLGSSDTADSGSTGDEGDQGVLGLGDILHLADGGDGMDTHHSHDGMARIASDLLT